MSDITRDSSLIWAENEDNPDYKLVTINAANEGFQSKMGRNVGSYFLTQFTQKLGENIGNNNNKRFLNEILDDIQEELHNDGKQLMVKTFNNKTEYIKFEMNKRNIRPQRLMIEGDEIPLMEIGTIQTSDMQASMEVSVEKEENDGLETK